MKTIRFLPQIPFYKDSFGTKYNDNNKIMVIPVTRISSQSSQTNHYSIKRGIDILFGESTVLKCIPFYIFKNI